MGKKYRIQYKLVGGTRVFTADLGENEARALMEDPQKLVMDVKEIKPVSYKSLEYKSNPNVSADDITIEDIDELIDQALQVRDETWFRDLANRRARMLRDMRRRGKAQ